MIAFAEHQFALARRRPDGATEREHLLSVERQTGRRPTALDGPAPPVDGTHVWAWFLELSAGRGSNGFGPNPISWFDLLAWTALTGTIIRPAEIEAIMALDRAWLKAPAGNVRDRPNSGDHPSDLPHKQGKSGLDRLRSYEPRRSAWSPV